MDDTAGFDFFLLIDFTCLILTGIVLYDLLKHKFSKLVSFAGVVVYYSLEFGPRYQLSNFWLSDSLAYLFVILCFWSIQRKEYQMYSIFLTVGILAKEVVLFTIPVFLIAYYKDDDEQDFLKIVFHILPAITVFLGIRLFVPVDDSVPYDMIAIITNLIVIRISHWSSELYRYTITTWGLFLMILPIFNKKQEVKEWVTQYGLFLVLVYFQLLLAENTERLLVLGFVPIIVLSLSGFQSISNKQSTIEKSYLLITVLYFVYRLITNAPFDSTDPFVNHVIFCVPTFFALFVIQRFLRKRQGDAIPSVVDSESNYEKRTLY